MNAHAFLMGVLVATLLVSIGLNVWQYRQRKAESFHKEVFPNGDIDRRFRPYIDQEETLRNTALWNPHVPHNFGLYESDIGFSCGKWKDQFQDKK